VNIEPDQGDGGQAIDGTTEISPKIPTSSTLLEVLFSLVCTASLTLFLLWLAATIAGKSYFKTIPDWVQIMSSHFWAFFTRGSWIALILYFFKVQIKKPTISLGRIVSASLLCVIVVPGTSCIMTKITSPPLYPDLGKKAGPEAPSLQESARLMKLANSVDAMSEVELKSNFGQIFFVGSNSNELTPTPRTALATLIEDYNVGGLIFYDTAVKPDTNPGVRTDNFIHLLNAIKERTKQLGSLPLFLATDFEGGDAAPLAKAGVLTPMPSAMAIGGTRDRSIARAAGNIVGAEMKAVGLNMNFAPVIDVSVSSEDSVILDRSFGADQHFVQEMASAFASGLKTQGIIPVLKHFPGHGGTDAGFESAGVPESSYDVPTLNQALTPFREMVKSGAPAIMTSHFRANSISKNIVTFDKVIIGDLLRTPKIVKLATGKAQGVDFQGLVIADNLLAPSITGEPNVCQANLDKFPDRIFEITIAAFEAGHDLLMFSHIFNDGTTLREMVKPELTDTPTTCCRWAMTTKEFGVLYERTKNYIFNPADPAKKYANIIRLRSTLKRIFTAKAQIANDFTQPKRIESLCELRQQNAFQSWAKKIFQETFVVRRPVTGGAPFSNATKNDHVVVFMPSRWPTYEKIEKLRTNKVNYAKQVRKEVEDFDWARAIRDQFSDQTNLFFEIEKYNPCSVKEWKQRAKQIREIVVDEYAADYVVFILNKKVRWGVAQNAIVELQNAGFDIGNVTLLITHHPTMLRFMDPALLEMKKLICKPVYLVAYSGYGTRAPIFMKSLANGKLFESDAKPPIEVPGIFSTPNLVTRDQNFLTNFKFTQD